MPIRTPTSEELEQQRSRPDQELSSPQFHVVLLEPEIPNNTGSIGRTCVGLGMKLWLVRPLGFQINDRQLRRAGLDYWPHLCWEAVDDWDMLLKRLRHSTGTPAPRLWFFSKKASHLYTEVAFRPGDAFVFGRESVGLPESLLQEHAENSLRIPTSDRIRSLNVSVAVGVVAFEAARQVSLLSL
ncbi:MAG: tRNA (cytidine(34)-2'-O)-methyltransferase [Planctomycetia bacterium]|nr:tRNA (cytidine(34)-2'-O)-methyltransferase [Planctomycetia bacterium]